MQKYFVLIVLFIVSNIIIQQNVSAHMDAGFDDVVDGYLIDFGYAPEKPTALNSTILNFNLVKNSTQEIVNFTSIFIRISDSKNNIFSGSFKPSHDNVNFIFTFPKEGKYEISTRFYNDADIIVENNYNLEVAANPNIKASDPDLLYVSITLIIMLAVIVYLIIALRSKKKK